MSKSTTLRDGLKVPVLSGEAAAKLIEDGAVITISSSSALGCPDFVLKAIGERFEKESSPKNLPAAHLRRFGIFQSHPTLSAASDQSLQRALRGPDQQRRLRG